MLAGEKHAEEDRQRVAGVDGTAIELHCLICPGVDLQDRAAAPVVPQLELMAAGVHWQRQLLTVADHTPTLSVDHHPVAGAGVDLGLGPPEVDGGINLVGHARDVTARRGAPAGTAEDRGAHGAGDGVRPVPPAQVPRSPAVGSGSGRMTR